MPTSAPSSHTLVICWGDDPSDSSDGIPAFNDLADTAITPLPMAIEAIPEQRTRRIAPMEMRDKVRLFWALESAARYARVDLDCTPMPAVNPTAIHLWSRKWHELCDWLAVEKRHRWIGVSIDTVMPLELRETSRYILDSLADGLPLMRNRIISAGPETFVYVPFREE